MPFHDLSEIGPGVSSATRIFLTPVESAVVPAFSPPQATIRLSRATAVKRANRIVYIKVSLPAFSRIDASTVAL